MHKPQTCIQAELIGNKPYEERKQDIARIRKWNSIWKNYICCNSVKTRQCQSQSIYKVQRNQCPKELVLARNKNKLKFVLVESKINLFIDSISYNFPTGMKIKFYFLLSNIAKLFSFKYLQHSSLSSEINYICKKRYEKKITALNFFRCTTN